MYFSALEIPQYGVFDSRVKFPKAFKTESRVVPCFEIELYTENQAGTAYLNDRAIPLRKGTLICAKPGHIRRSMLHFKCLHIHLKTEDPFLTNVLNRLPDHAMVSDLIPFTEVFQQILMLDMATFPEQQLLFQSHLYRFIYLLMEENRIAETLPGKAVYEHKQTIAQAESYIRSHLNEDLDLKHLASHANLSPIYFHKLFCAHLGMTPAAFVLSCRIAAAKAMLKTGDRSISEIASSCGFSSQSYFNYKFKDVVGETPLQYRKTRLSLLKL